LLAANLVQSAIDADDNELVLFDDDGSHRLGRTSKLEQARMLSLVEPAEKAFTPSAMSPQEAERLANALDRALDDDD